MAVISNLFEIMGGNPYAKTHVVIHQHFTEQTSFLGTGEVCLVACVFGVMA
jgi:hypothetical protein